eukprot:COSAG01_NODE_1655_length_9606_cov_29.510361_5_plen_46_part_00
MGVILLWVGVFPRRSLNTILAAQQQPGSAYKILSICNFLLILYTY